MKVTVLGSAAAEAIPAIWCECDICKQAKALKGKDIRRRASYLLNDDTLIDFGPDAFSQFNDLADPLAIRRIFFTHSHQDHLNAHDLLWRLSGYSVASQNIRIYGNDAVIRKIRAAQIDASALAQVPDYRMELVRVLPNQDITDGDLTVWPVRANHEPREVPLIYGFEQGGRRVLIANDTGMLGEASLQHLRDKKFDLAMIDATCGKIDCRDHHLGAQNVLDFCRELRAAGALGDHSKVVVNHFSHNGQMLHRDLEAFFGPHGIGVGFDNMVIDLKPL